MHPCERCGAPILEKYRICFLCMRDAQESQKGAYNAQTPQNPYYTHPRYENAPERKETPYTKRPEGSGEPHMTWEEAHDENMQANLMLVDAVNRLSTVMEGFTKMVADLKTSRCRRPDVENPHHIGEQNQYMTEDAEVEKR